MRTLRLMIVSSLLAASLLLSGCQNGPTNGSPQILQAAEAAAASYRLAPGDKVRVTVFGEDNLSGEYTVLPDGNIVLPLAGNVKAIGLTFAQLQDSISTALQRGYVKDPNVTVQVASLRPFYILGEVKKPGQYSYMPDLTVLAAVATAEGFTYRADMSSVYIRHAHEAAERKYKLTVSTIVQPGDTIRITERYF